MINKPGILHLDINGEPVERLPIQSDPKRQAEDLKTIYQLTKNHYYEFYFYAESKMNGPVINQPCVLSEKGRKLYPRIVNKNGIVLKESQKNKECWVVLWGGNVRPLSYYKDLIEIV